jgi:adenylate cyclase class 2
MLSKIEAKFLDVDYDQLKVRLKSAGATCMHPDRLTKRLTMDFPDKRLRRTANGWVRVRDEGDRITLTYKQLNDRSIAGMQEVEAVVDDFEKTEELLKAIGLERCAYQETRRETWELDGVEIDLDQWPWIRPFVEVEGPHEAAVWSVVRKLGLDRSKAEYGSVEIVYQAEYDVTEEEIDNWERITFTKTPDWLKVKARKKS